MEACRYLHSKLQKVILTNHSWLQFWDVSQIYWTWKQVATGRVETGPNQKSVKKWNHRNPRSNKLKSTELVLKCSVKIVRFCLKQEITLVHFTRSCSWKDIPTWTKYCLKPGASITHTTNFYRFEVYIFILKKRGGGRPHSILAKTTAHNFIFPVQKLDVNWVCLELTRGTEIWLSRKTTLPQFLCLGTWDCAYTPLSIQGNFC